MWKTLRALITGPPDLAAGIWLDDNVTKVLVELFMPLSLQLFCKQADVGPTSLKLLLLRLLPARIAVADVRGNLCRSTCMPSARSASSRRC